MISNIFNDNTYKYSVNCRVYIIYPQRKPSFKENPSLISIKIRIPTIQFLSLKSSNFVGSIRSPDGSILGIIDTILVNGSLKLYLYMHWIRFCDEKRFRSILIQFEEKIGHVDGQCNVGNFEPLSVCLVYMGGLLLNDGHSLEINVQCH